MTVREMKSLLEGCPDHGRIEWEDRYGSWESIDVEKVRIIIQPQQGKMVDNP